MHIPKNSTKCKKRNKDQKIRAKRKAPLNKASPDNHVKFMPGSARLSSELVRILQVFGVNWYACLIVITILP